jgi:hypothetical protein
MKPLPVKERRDRTDDRSLAGGSVGSETARMSPVAENSLRQLEQVTRREFISANDQRSLKNAVVAQLRRTSDLVHAFWYNGAGSLPDQIDRLEGLLFPGEGINPALRRQLTHSAVSAVKCQELQSNPVDGTSLTLVAMPVSALEDQCLIVLVERLSAQGSATMGPFDSLLLLWTLISEWSVRQVLNKTTETACSVAAILELSNTVQSAVDSTAACRNLAEELQSWLQADEVIVGLCKSGTSECRVAAISGKQVIDQLSGRARLLDSALQETVIRKAGATWPVQDPANRHALLAHQQLCEAEAGKVLVSMPLQTPTGKSEGVVLAFFSGASTESESDLRGRISRAERYLRAAAEPLASAFGMLERCADNFWLKWSASLFRMMTVTRLHLAAWAVGIIVLLLLVPVTYTVHATAELQPVKRRFAAAPFDGPLQECLVEPGDIVQKDQLLARMDGREIRWELAEVQASLNKAIKERNTQVSQREFGSAAITGHEIQRLEQRLALLTHRNESLDIRSPSDGVVVSGDHKEAEGVPLETGQTLFEIAPLDAMIIEISVPEEDVRHVIEGMEVSIQLDAIPADTLHASIRALHPRAELRDGHNVFVAEADTENTNGILRPGMRGQARVLTARHMLGWNLFHKPCAYVLGWLGW